MKTIIILVGAQGTLKSTFLNRLNIPQFFVEDFKRVKDFHNKPNLICITTNDLILNDIDKLNSLCDLCGDAHIVIFKLPSKKENGNRAFYQRLELYLIKAFAPTFNEWLSKNYTRLPYDIKFIKIEDPSSDSFTGSELLDIYNNGRWTP